MNNAQSSKWWREPRASDEACQTEEEFRARVGEYTLRCLFETSQFALGYTAADEAFQFDLGTVRRIEALHLQMMIALREGTIRRVRAAEDFAFQRFIAASTGRARQG
jgi:hypothetical protein